MDTGKRKELKRHLKEKIAVIKEDIKSYELLTKPIPPDNALGRLTRMDAINSKSINEAALRKSKSALSRLERALSMIDAPDFGVCVECEEPIPFGRLMAMPGTALCVQCAENMNE